MTATITIMATAPISIRMTADAAKLMRLQSWLSPAFPIGAYSYSHGLERAVETGAVRNRATLVDWLEADLRYGAGRTDGIFFAQTWRAVRGIPTRERPDAVVEPGTADLPTALPLPLPWGEGGGEGVRIIDRAPALSPCERESGRAADDTGVSDRERASKAGGTITSEIRPDQHPGAPCRFLTIAELAAAMRATSELALESSQQGIAFLTAVRNAWPHPALERLATALRHAGIPAMLPVAAAAACAVHDIDLDHALPLYLHASVANLINAAVRLIPLGQTDGQRALAALETAVAETATAALAAALGDIGSAAFMIDIVSMQHETQYTRLFRS